MPIMNEAELKEAHEPRERRMWWHWQPLMKEAGSKWWGLVHGRAWLHFRSKGKHPGNSVRLEWHLWRAAFGISMDIDDEDLTFYIALPPVSIWLSFTVWFWIIAKLAPREPLSPNYPDTIVIPDRELSMRIHSGAVWMKFWGSRDSWTRSDPWWKRGVNFSINPFEWKFMRHEVRVVSPHPNPDWSGPPFGRWAPASKGWYLSSEGPPPDSRELFEFSYRYFLKSGEVQLRTARVCVERRAWRPRCLRWTSLFEKVRTSLDIKFSEEIGERTGSWKGGCTGCGWDLLPGETPEEALRRMELTRKF